MQTRVKKWRRYRRRIERSRKLERMIIEDANSNGKTTIYAACKPSLAIDLSAIGIKKRRNSWLNSFKSSDKVVLIAKILLLALAIVAFILLWELWVIKG